MSIASKTMVTLVHGTWAWKAPWTRKGSKLSTALEDTGYRVERLDWKAWNRYTARSKGGEQLRDHLRRHSSFEHIVIAHSHGGTLALRALDGDDDLIKGLICLNTPFLNVLGRDAGIFRNLGMFTAVAAGMIPIGLGLRNGFAWSLALVYLAILVVTGIAGGLFDPFHALTVKRGQRLRFKPLETTPIYCLTAPDDEAFGVLAFLVAVQNFLFLTICRGVLTSKLIGAVLGGLLLFEGLPLLRLPWDLFTGEYMFTRELFAALQASSSPENPWRALLVPLQWAGLYLLSSFYYLALYPLAVLLVLAGLSILVTSSQGFFLPLSGLFNRFLVTLVPLEAVNTRFEELPGDAKRVRHSSLYDDPKAIGAILAWIAAR